MLVFGDARPILDRQRIDIVCYELIILLLVIGC
jgi:hypothetical protein